VPPLQLKNGDKRNLVQSYHHCPNHISIMCTWSTSDNSPQSPSMKSSQNPVKVKWIH